MKKALFVLFLITWGNAQAHDLWLKKVGDTYKLYYGHQHSGHDGAKFVQYQPENVLRVECFDDKGQPQKSNASKTYPVSITGNCAVVYVMTSSGYWTKTPYGTKNIPKDQAQSSLRSWVSYESVKRIDHWNSMLSKSLTNDLELVPLNNPLSLEAGEKLRLLVTFEGRPAKDVIVSYNGKPRGQTGKDGRINLRLRHGGFQIIQASYTMPLESEKADEIVHMTSLNFETRIEK